MPFRLVDGEMVPFEWIPDDKTLDADNKKVEKVIKYYRDGKSPEDLKKFLAKFPHAVLKPDRNAPKTAIVKKVKKASVKKASVKKEAFKTPEVKKKASKTAEVATTRAREKVNVKRRSGLA